MTDDEKRAYSKGYNAGARRAWPAHKSPVSKGVVGEILAAAQELRDGIDGELATFAEDDELNIALGPLIDRYDEAMMKLNNWIREKE